MRLPAAGEIVAGSFRGWPAHILQSEECAVTIVPELGGKIASIVHHRTGREFLAQPVADPVAPLEVDGRFVENDPFGFDDMFPTILAGPMTLDNGQTITLPDHGEVWSRAWKHERSNDAVRLTLDGSVLPYRLSKSCALSAPRTLGIDYTLTNLAAFGYDAIWAAHPLIDCADAVEIELPPGEVVSVCDGSQHYGNRGDRSRWQALALGRTAAGQRAQGHKFYVAKPNQVRESAVRFPLSRERIAIRFQSREPSYFGLWHEERPDGARIIAPEPCTGGFDRPDLARRGGQTCHLAARETKRWRLELEISSLP
jgi:galactose mutarotase-like enzyme